MIKFSNEIYKSYEKLNHNVLDEYKHLSIEERIQISKSDRLPYDVCLLNLTGELNVGTIIRSAYLLGAEKIWCVGRRKFDKRSTVGVEHYINIERVSGLVNDEILEIDVDIFKNIVYSKDYIPVCCETRGVALGSFNWNNIIGKKRPLLIFGNEGKGIQNNILNEVEKLNGIKVSIPQRGVMRSFNVSSAASIILYDLYSKVNWEER